MSNRNNPNRQQQASTQQPKADAQVVLYGSDNFAAILVLFEGGPSVQLGEIVQAAFAASKLSAEDWNKLEVADRDAHIQSALNEATEKAKALAAEAAAAEEARLAELAAEQREASIVTIVHESGEKVSFSHGGEAYETNAKGEVKVPRDYADALSGHGFKRK